MNWLHWSDLITPTNPVAALFLGVIISLVFAIYIGFETKEKKSLLIALLIGCSTSVIVVFILRLIGFY